MFISITVKKRFDYTQIACTGLNQKRFHLIRLVALLRIKHMHGFFMKHNITVFSAGFTE